MQRASKSQSQAPVEVKGMMGARKSAAGAAAVAGESRPADGGAGQGASSKDLEMSFLERMEMWKEQHR